MTYVQHSHQEKGSFEHILIETLFAYGSLRCYFAFRIIYLLTLKFKLLVFIMILIEVTQF